MKYQPKGRPRGSSSDDGKPNYNKRAGLIYFLYFYSIIFK